MVSSGREEAYSLHWRIACSWPNSMRISCSFTPCFAARTWVQGTVTVRFTKTWCFSSSSMLTLTSPAVLFSTGITP